MNQNRPEPPPGVYHDQSFAVVVLSWDNRCYGLEAKGDVAKIVASYWRSPEPPDGTPPGVYVWNGTITVTPVPEAEIDEETFTIDYKGEWTKVHILT